ncbi:MAG TPA: hypothetical protein VK689_02910, partial [Armatimonadota bacterium]|nr:hypothetical protein [Armatimonadota bacterium]
MMKVDVFESVCKADASRAGGSPDPMYRYEFLAQHNLAQVQNLPPRTFIGRLFDDVLDSVTNDDNYLGKNVFDKEVFQKFIAVMFVNYATTDPLFYGTSRDDYGVSSDKDMTETPLYQAVASALRRLERGDESLGPEPDTHSGPDLSSVFGDDSGDSFLQALQQAGHTVEIPFGVEQTLLQPLTLLAEAVRLLKNVDHAHVPEIRAMACNAGQQIFRTLQELQILSPLASDPLEDTLGD